MTTYRLTKKTKAIKGTGGEDDFFGSIFNDTFEGRAGIDYIYGDEGNDRLKGGDDDDHVYGGAGNDKLYGDAGDDYIYGGAGNDWLYGGIDDDYLSGDEGNDRLDGGAGRDELIGGFGNDNLSGGAGNDLLDGREYTYGADFVAGKDRLLGGDGNDRVMVDDGDYALGGKGVDVLSLQIYSGAIAPTKYLIDFSKITGKKAADIGHAGIKAGQFEKVAVQIEDMEVGSVITGSKGSDWISCDGNGGVINGGAGNDTLWAYGYDRKPGSGFIVNGGTGNDKLSGYGNVTLVGGAGDDQFTLSRNSGSTIADFSGKDYFLIKMSDFRYFDYNLNKYVAPVFDKANPVVSGADPKPASTFAQFFYDTDDGKLYYDADGVGLNYDLQLVTTLANKAVLNASHFVFVA